MHLAPTRREFIRHALAAGGALVAQVPGAALAQPHQPALRVLILGGTNFIGPHLVKDLLDRNHEVTIFTRGRRTPALHAELFDQVEHLEGDRDGNLQSLVGRTWDAVIDNSGPACRMGTRLRNPARRLRPLLHVRVIDRRVLPVPHDEHPRGRTCPAH